MNTYNPRQVVELFHLLFLNQLGRKLEKKLYALKGGCNMRFYFNSIRYSEDMDLDIQIIAKETLRNKVRQILNSTPFISILKSKSIEISDVSEPKQTDTTQRWKISLKASGILSIPTKIEFSRRGLSDEVRFEQVNSPILRQYQLSPFMANHYAVNKMYEQKILALALRSQTQARDVFDLYLLINSYAELTISDVEIIKHLPEAQTNLLGISFADFKSQVVAYLSDDEREQYNNESIWNNVVSIVYSKLENIDEIN